jgi:hypothetical protein
MARLIGDQIGSSEFDVGVTRAFRTGVAHRPNGVTYKGDFNVSSVVCHFACNVAAGTLRVPRCRWADSPSVNNSGDFFGGAPLQGS